ncbi:MAG: hypothetical protein ACR2QW_04915 [bacterium]
MTKSHRIFHRSFWYVALPVLLIWLLVISPGDNSNTDNLSEPPPGGHISIVDKAG